MVEDKKGEGTSGKPPTGDYTKNIDEITQLKARFLGASGEENMSGVFRSLPNLEACMKNDPKKTIDFFEGLTGEDLILRAEKLEDFQEDIKPKPKKDDSTVIGPIASPQPARQEAQEEITEEQCYFRPDIEAMGIIAPVTKLIEKGIVEHYIFGNNPEDVGISKEQIFGHFPEQVTTYEKSIEPIPSQPTPEISPNDMITYEQASEVYGTDVAGIELLVQRGDLKAERKGREIRVKLGDIITEKLGKKELQEVSQPDEVKPPSRVTIERSVLTNEEEFTKRRLAEAEAICDNSGIDSSKVGEHNYQLLVRFSRELEVGPHQAIETRKEILKQGLDIIINEKELKRGVEFVADYNTPEEHVELINNIIRVIGFDPRDAVDEKNCLRVHNFIVNLTKGHIANKQFIKQSLEAITELEVTEIQVTPEERAQIVLNLKREAEAYGINIKKELIERLTDDEIYEAHQERERILITEENAGKTISHNLRAMVLYDALRIKIKFTPEEQAEQNRLNLQFEEKLAKKPTISAGEDSVEKLRKLARKVGIEEKYIPIIDKNRNPDIDYKLNIALDKISEPERSNEAYVEHVMRKVLENYELPAEPRKEAEVAKTDQGYSREEITAKLSKADELIRDLKNLQDVKKDLNKTTSQLRAQTPEQAKLTFQARQDIYNENFTKVNGYELDILSRIGNYIEDQEKSKEVGFKERIVEIEKNLFEMGSFLNEIPPETNLESYIRNLARDEQSQPSEQTYQPSQELVTPELEAEVAEAEGEQRVKAIKYAKQTEEISQALKTGGEVEIELDPEIEDIVRQMKAYGEKDGKQ